jgi:hypothetical protein
MNLATYLPLDAFQQDGEVAIVFSNYASEGTDRVGSLAASQVPPELTDATGSFRKPTTW